MLWLKPEQFSRENSSGTVGRTKTEKRSMGNQEEGAKMTPEPETLPTQNTTKPLLESNTLSCCSSLNSKVIDSFVVYFVSGYFFSLFLPPWLNKQNEQGTMGRSPLPSLNLCGWV